MRKREILKHYKSSLEKWEAILKDIKNKNVYNYTIHWESETCGFCSAHPSCVGCTLGVFCGPRTITALFLARDGQWLKAEKPCKQFIAKIKREIKKVEAK